MGSVSYLLSVNDQNKDHWTHRKANIPILKSVFIDHSMNPCICLDIPYRYNTHLKGILALALVFTKVWSILVCSNANVISYFNVRDYGAAGDGSTDDSQAVLKAWSAMCKTPTGIPTMVVPSGKTFLVNPISFDGPCMAKKISVQIIGNIIAPSKTDAWKGKDQSTWIRFAKVSGLSVSGPGTVDGRGSAWWDQSCRYHHVQVMTVSQLEITHQMLVSKGGKGYAQRITFENINFTTVENPIIIDQYYCNIPYGCKDMPTGVKISQVTYNGMIGTSRSEVAINLNCSDRAACTGIRLESIKLEAASPGKQLNANCNNAYGKTIGVVEPKAPCLKNFN
ncbi:PREDICTED: polygalacturonase-like [Nelumbo nucifera]|uniref:Polygalacturonase-like n=1 Tax=Nelumbo nucifera TaxID=4432 RepID=A0A1U8Q355_NELNU|nr:PREDICTED: polygalacturonase-like [Nelumbo nucifera]